MVRATSKTSIERTKERVLCYEKCYAIHCYYCDWYYRTYRRCAIPGAGFWLSSCTRRRWHRNWRDPADYRYCWYDGDAQQKPRLIYESFRLLASAVYTFLKFTPWQIGRESCRERV